MATRKRNSPVGIGMDSEWQAQSDPKRVKAVQELAQRQMVAAAGAMADNND